VCEFDTFLFGIFKQSNSEWEVQAVHQTLRLVPL
jgi:hypothetical protein